MEQSIMGRGFLCTNWKPLLRQLQNSAKLATILLLIFSLHAGASGFSQTVSFTGKDVPLQSVFAAFEKQTGCSFFFNYALLKDAKPITLDIHNAPLEAALDQILKKENLDFYRAGKTIFIVGKKDKKIAGEGKEDGNPPGKAITVKGSVTNQQGEALAGATVAVKNGLKMTLTDERGEFELKEVVSGSVLEISYLGYQKKEVVAEEQQKIRVEMAATNSNLDEVQVIAYGQTTARLNPGNVTVVKASELEKQPTTNPLLALEGRVPGLVITQSSGLPGSGVNLLIQGQNSIAKGNDPFYVIDGVPYTSALLPNFGSIMGSSGIPGNNVQNGNPLSFINPMDIESISVLKDADATAIYGSRAANGAILITTKKGKIGKTKVDLNTQSGWGSVGHKLDLMNTPQYLQMRHEAKANDKLAITATDYDINGTWDSTRSVDWQKELIGKTAGYLDAGGSVSGGDVNTQFLIGGSFHRETPVFPTNSFSDAKGSLHFSINNSSTNKRFKIQLSGSYQIDNNRLPLSDLTLSATTFAPDAPPLYNKDGSVNWQPNASGNSSWTNPIATLYTTYQNKTTNLIANSTLSYELFRGLSLSANLGYTNLQSNDLVRLPLLSYMPEIRANNPRIGEYGNNTINSWIVEPQVNYKRAVGAGKIEVTVGSTIQRRNSNGQQYLGQGFNSDAAIADIHSAATVQSISSIASAYLYNALYGRINYIWNEKYIVDITGRRDGSSRFGGSNEFHNFGAVGLGWVFSQESFIADNFKFLTFGKLRGSYGTTGNDQIGDYQFLNLYTPLTGNVANAYQGISALAPAGLPNPYLQWEQTRKLQFGADLGALNNRLLLNASYFVNRSSNELLSYVLPIITGFSSITRNLPATVQNSGWELALSTVNIRYRGFTWTSAISLTIPQNKLVSFPNLANSPYASTYIVGQPITIKKLYHYLGVDPATGIYQFQDSHGNPNPKPTFTTDATVISNSAPRMYGGFDNTFRYGGIELDLFFQGVKQMGVNYKYGYYVPGILSGANGNQPTTLLHRWQNPGDVSTHEKYSSTSTLLTSNNNMTASDAGFSDASYIRLKNVSLSWELPASWVEKAHLQYFKLYGRAQNLFTITRYYGLDPETRSNSILPPIRVITIGVQIGIQ